MNIKAQAQAIAARFANGAAHDVKVTECKASQFRPAYSVFVRLAGQARGKCVATIIL